MQEYGRIEIDVLDAGFLLSRPVGRRITAAEPEHDLAFGQLMGVTLRFDGGAVRLHSDSGNPMFAEAPL